MASQEDDWGSLSVTMPVNTLVVATLVVHVDDEGRPVFGQGLHIPDPDVEDLAKVTAALGLQRFAEAMKAETEDIKYVALPTRDEDEDDFDDHGNRITRV